MVTVKLESTQANRISVQAVYSILRRFWPPAICDSVRSMKGMRNQSGAVFDLYEDQYIRLWNYEDNKCELEMNFAFGLGD